MNDILPLAQRMLRDYGEFYPYGGVIKSDGEIVHVGAKHPDTDHPKSKDLIDMLRSSFHEMARTGKCRAAAIVFDVRVKLPDSDNKTDAVQVSLDHVDGYSVDIFFPYRIINREVVYGKTFSLKGTHNIFGDL